MLKDKNTDLDRAIKGYHDSSGLSVGKLNFGLWLSENYKYFVRIFTIALIVLSGFFFAYSAYHYYRFFSSPSLSPGLDNIAVSPRRLTNDIQVSGLDIFANSDKYDLAAKIKNPNDKFKGTYDYCLSQKDKEITCFGGFVLPGQEKYLVMLGQELPDGESGVSLTLKNVAWQRISTKDIPDWSIFYYDRLNFIFRDTNFSPAADSGLSEKINLNSLSFSVKNDTSFGYYSMPLTILLFSGEQLVGVNRYILNDFLSGSEKDVNMSWAGNMPKVTKVDIQPDINITEESVYSKYQGQVEK